MMKLRVELNDMGLATPVSRDRLRRNIIAALGMGTGLLLLAILAITVSLVLGNWTVENEVGIMVIGGVGALLVYNGITRSTWLRKHTGTRELRLGAPYAFEMSGDAIFFPEQPSRPAETWPLGATTIDVVKRFGQRWLVLRSPGHTTRRYPQSVLATPIDEIIVSLSGSA